MFLKGISDSQKWEWHCEAETHREFWLAGAARLGLFPALDKPDKPWCCYLHS